MEWTLFILNMQKFITVIIQLLIFGGPQQVSLHAEPKTQHILYQLTSHTYQLCAGHYRCVCGHSVWLSPCL